jgi:hypothetical protein
VEGRNLEGHSKTEDVAGHRGRGKKKEKKNKRETGVAFLV